MIWGEFKKAVEQQGTVDDDRIDWIEFHPTSTESSPVATFSRNGKSVVISD